MMSTAIPYRTRPISSLIADMQEIPRSMTVKLKLKARANVDGQVDSADVAGCSVLSISSLEEYNERQ